mmetsp:Transcript_8544/g.14686  ORF Transcript_8544/g.14686 Transcript_8544/m.14686 type:complete len:146 (-) Transcript_8544:308-745(-)
MPASIPPSPSSIATLYAASHAAQPLVNFGLRLVSPNLDSHLALQDFPCRQTQTSQTTVVSHMIAQGLSQSQSGCGVWAMSAHSISQPKVYPADCIKHFQYKYSLSIKHSCPSQTISALVHPYTAARADVGPPIRSAQSNMCDLPE